MADKKREISTQLLNFSASAKRESNKTTIAISWNLNGLHHAVIRIKKVQAEADNEVDWAGVEVADTLTMDQGVTSTEYDGAQEGYKYQIEGVGVDVFGDTSEAANTPKVEVFIPKAVEPNPDPEPDPSPEQPTEKLFEFHYVPDEGVLPGLIFEQQTKDVINDIGNHAYFAKKTASKALKTGLEASKAARTALNAAQNAQSTADRATELGNTGISKANAAQETADKALKKAEANEVSIAVNSSSIATLQNTVNGQQTQLDGNLTNISGLKKQVAENKQSIDGNSKGISQCMMTIQESQAYTTTDKMDANDLTDYGRIYLPNALLHCPSGVTYPVLLDVVPSYFGDSEIDDVVVQRVVDANGVSFYRLATEETADATITYNFGDWKSIDTCYLKLTGGTVTGQTTFSGKLTASGETSVPTPSTENNSKTIANTEFVHGVVSDLVNGAPDALNTLQELATALGNDPNFSTTVLNKIGEKESKTDAQIEYEKLQNAIPTQYVQSVTESNGEVTVTKGSGESTTFNTGLTGNMALWNYLHRLGNNPTLPTTNHELNALGVFMSYFYQNKIANQPSSHGQLINLPVNKGDESAQLWIEQVSGQMYHRGGNASNAINDTPFTRFLDTDDATQLQNKIPTKVSQLNDDRNLVTTEEVDTKISEVIALIIDMLYPVGTVYMSADKSKTKADFSFMQYGTWEEVPANLCVQTGTTSEAGTQRSAGLPNITGRRAAVWGGADYDARSTIAGCFKSDCDPNIPTTVDAKDWNKFEKGTGFAFDASLSNPIYGASDTVQPPAYIVRAWVRTA